jgi:hypothetical protein
MSPLVSASYTVVDQTMDATDNELVEIQYMGVALSIAKSPSSSPKLEAHAAGRSVGAGTLLTPAAGVGPQDRLGGLVHEYGRAA